MGPSLSQSHVNEEIPNAICSQEEIKKIGNELMRKLVGREELCMRRNVSGSFPFFVFRNPIEFNKLLEDLFTPSIPYPASEQILLVNKLWHRME